MPRASCIYQGRIRHRRYTPKHREFTYSMFMMYLDLSEIDEIFAESRLWSNNRRNLAWLNRKDFIAPHELSITDAVRARVLEESGREVEGPIRMLAHLRYFGYCFNPVTIYYCFDSTGTRIQTVVAEINNTPWNERYAYVLPVEEGREHEHRARFEMEKVFHVSPFWPMNHSYDWSFTNPADSLVVHMKNHQENELVFDATLSLRRREASTQNLRQVLLAYPAMTMKVAGAIYWQALRLRLGGARFYSHPDNTSETV